MSFLFRMFGTPTTSVQRITCAEYKARFMDGNAVHTLVDVRTREEFNSGFIPGAVNIALQDIEQKMTQIAKDKPVILYCRSGNRSAMAAQQLMQAGYTDVYNLGGIIDWTSNGLPIKTRK